MDAKTFFTRRRGGGNPLGGLIQTAVDTSGNIFTTLDGWETIESRGAFGSGMGQTSVIGINPDNPLEQWVLQSASSLYYTRDGWQTINSVSMTGYTTVSGAQVRRVSARCIDNSKFSSEGVDNILCAFDQLESENYLPTGYYNLGTLTIPLQQMSPATKGMEFKTVSKLIHDPVVFSPATKTLVVGSTVFAGIDFFSDTNAYNKAFAAGGSAVQFVSPSNDDRRTFNYWKLDGVNVSIALRDSIRYDGDINNYATNGGIRQYEGTTAQLLATGAGLYRVQYPGDPGGYETIPLSGLVPETSGIAMADCAVSSSDSDTQSCVAANGYIYTTRNNWTNVKRVDALGARQWALIVIN